MSPLVKKIFNSAIFLITMIAVILIIGDSFKLLQMELNIRTFQFTKTYQRKRLNCKYFIKMLESTPKMSSIFAKFTL